MLEDLRLNIHASGRPAPLDADPLVEDALIDAEHFDTLLSGPDHVLLELEEHLLVRDLLQIIVWPTPAPPNFYLLESDFLRLEVPIQSKVGDRPHHTGWVL